MNKFKFFAFLMAFVALAFTSCKDDDDNKDDGPDTPLVEDGVYLIAEGSAVMEPSSKGKFATTPNEADMDEDRPGLMDIFMPIEANTTFTIREVAGATTVNYGSSDIAAVDKTAEGESADQPATNIWRGTLSEDANEFTVAESGMYHIFFDKVSMKVGYAKVEWGAIGSAWANGWGGSVQFEEGAFDKETMSWSVKEAVIKKSDWKFRYSDAWKAFLVYDEAGDVAVNCNFGGTLTDLKPGGDNISQAEAGYYDMTITWTLENGYSVSEDKIRDLEATDWSAIKFDIVGSAVSADNPDAEVDGSSWAWGNVLLADNMGLPTVDGSVYTYTWTTTVLEKEALNGDDVLEAASCKIRVANGEGVDLGYDILDVEASSDKIVDAGNNLSVSEKATFNITLTIDAQPGEDITKIVITDVE